MDIKELFTIWAPVDSVWSRWAKPVLFTTIYGPINPQAELLPALPDVSSRDGSIGDTALIINLSGTDAVLNGLALLSRGFRPVPLFNATAGIDALKDVRPIATMMINGAPILQKAILATNPPPAFLIDSQRLDGHPLPGQFDNRWVVFPQDFPSGTFLQSQGIRNIILIQNSDAIDPDLAEVCALWKRSGLDIQMTNAGKPWEKEAPGLRSVTGVGLLRTLLIFRLMSSFGLRRSSAGGFGSTIPQQTSG